MRIRKARRGDLEQIFQNILDCKADMKAKQLEQWNTRHPTYADTKRSIPTAFVVEDDGNVIASACLNEDKPGFSKNVLWQLSNKKYVNLERLVVRPEYQGTGVAQKLLRFLEKHAKKQGYASIRLGTYSNNVRAIRFYQKNKYKKQGTFNTTHMPKQYLAFQKILTPKKR